MRRLTAGKLAVLYAASALLVLSGVLPAYAVSEGEYRALSLFFDEEQLAVSAARIEKPVSQTAEDVTIITSDDIVSMNAHTLTDVLYNVPGVEMDIRGGPGSGTTVHIQGSESRHVLVIIDGVEWNNLSDNFADVSSMPVQNIDRVEIIEGPASSSWGSSLGGVINVITKAAGASKAMAGLFSGSFGEENTGDYRAEISGKVKDVGYYVYAGNLVTDGLRPNTNFRRNDIYTKLKWDAGGKASFLWTLGYSKGSRGDGEAPVFDLKFGDDFEYFFSTLALEYKISDYADVDFSLRTVRRTVEQSLGLLSTGEVIDKSNADDKGYGGSIKLTLRKGIHHVVLGSDYDNGDLRSDIINGGKQTLEKWAVFTNDTMVFGQFSITPGIRYDHTSTNGEFVSPSLGVTYRLGEKTMVRGYVARGFSIPPLAATFGTGFFSLPNPDLGVEKVWSYQAGIESTALRYLWMKTTLFMHDIKDAIVNEVLPDQTFKAVNRDRQRRQGFEVELKTAPLHKTSFSAAFVFIDAEDRGTGRTLTEVPRYSCDIGVHYNDKRSFQALLKGHYIWWNSGPDLGGNYNAFIWDMNIIKKLFKKEDRNVELFLTAHNIFNGSQYAIGDFRNPRRWIEGGARVTF